jgi:hypothetical protein
MDGGTNATMALAQKNWRDGHDLQCALASVWKNGPTVSRQVAKNFIGLDFAPTFFIIDQQNRILMS